jgi:hypothetical protein
MSRANRYFLLARAWYFASHSHLMCSIPISKLPF